jgi:hypothetical protein
LYFLPTPSLPEQGTGQLLGNAEDVAHSLRVAGRDGDDGGRVDAGAAGGEIGGS